MTTSNAERPHIVIVGAGALGSLIGGLLAESGLPVTLLSRNTAHPEAIAAQGGLRITGHGGDRIAPLRATSEPATVSDADVVVFLCKAPATHEAARGVVHLFRDDRAVAVSLQNGLGNEDVIASVVGERRVIGGLTSLGARLEAPGTVRNFADLPSIVGEMAGGLSPRASALAETFSRHGVPTEASPQIMRRKWLKLFANVAFSATSGATGLTIAEVASVPALRETALMAIDEAAAVAASTGIDIDPTERRSIYDTLTDPKGAGANTTSMHRDLAAGRLTEVDSIYGAIIALGRRNGVATPALSTLAAIIKGMEMAGTLATRRFGAAGNVNPIADAADAVARACPGSPPSNP